jgi:chemotaxis receptor (MCP) glutamine deamidase CheD
MKRRIDVHTGEIMAGQGEVVLQSDAQGACMVIVAYDAIRKIGGLAHALFSSGNGLHPWHSTLMKNAEGAIDEMVSDMTLLGSDKNDIEVALISGENISRGSQDPAYANRISETIELLKQKQIRFKENQAGDARHTHVCLDVASGNIVYS